MNETLAPTDSFAANGSMAVDFQANWEAPSSNSNDAPHTASLIRVGCVLRDRYVLEERLDIGGRGTVFKALDRYRSDLPEEDRYVAIKILHPTANDRGELVADLRREFYCAQTLSHESIVNVYQLDRDGDLDFFTMELLEGELLSSVLARLHPAAMSRPRAWAIIRDIGSGLAHAHSRNVIHADLKPHNIMMTHSGEVRMLDFSNAVGHYTEDGVHRKHAFSSGTLAYASCELLAGRAPDPRDDVYALACLSYELLAGEHPFQRRPATEARDLGIVPKRPPGLTRQQWQTLAMGLSWHRAGRSISVRAWLHKMHTERAAARRAPGVGGLQTAPPDRGSSASLRATTMFVVLLMTVSVWVSFVRWASGSRSTGDDAVPELVADQPDQPGQPDQPNQLNEPNRQPGEAPVATGQDGTPAADSGVPSAALSTTPPQTPESQPKLSTNRGHDASRPKQPPASDRPVLVSAGNYTVHAGEHFAEIRVRRSSLWPSDTEFLWWTEAASAKPGIDYVHQAKVIHSFPKGKNSTSFFVKLVPRALRARPEVFYVAIAEAGRNASADPVARAAVWLPINQDHPQSAAEHNAHTESDTHSDSRFSTAALGSPLAGSK
ncbi:MAG TPA: protein kinase [Steroidobacteraceae bacterium]|nr:protein kinase [Steroidobacteraceae bacterium]